MIYLASPYSHTNPTVCTTRYKANIWAAGRLVASLREPIYSPIVHSHPIHNAQNMPHTFWMNHDSEIFMICKSMIILQLDGWRVSEGIRIERVWAGWQSLHIYYVTMESLRENELPAAEPYERDSVL